MHTVLVAEDDIKFLTLLTRVFKKYSDRFDFLSVLNGKDAIDTLNQKTISLLVTDIMMPKVDGLELLAHVNEFQPLIPCIVMTAHAPDNPTEIISNDIVRLFRKPLDPDKVAKAIIQILDRDIPRGMLYGIPVVSFLRMIEMERKTCLFKVELPNKKSGLFFFEKGTLYDAACGNLKGEEAALELITMERAKYRFKYFPQKKIVKRITADLSRLITEAKRREMGLTPIDVVKSINKNPSQTLSV